MEKNEKNKKIQFFLKKKNFKNKTYILIIMTKEKKIIYKYNEVGGGDRIRSSTNLPIFCKATIVY